ETAMTSIWMIVNTDKYPIVVSDTSYYDIDECDYTDNVFQTLMPYKLLKTEEICQGDTYDFYGNILSTSGVYSHEIMNASGCDSVIVELNLGIKSCTTGCMEQCYSKKKFIPLSGPNGVDFAQKVWEGHEVSITCTPLIINVENDDIPELVIYKATNFYFSNEIFIIDSKTFTIVNKVNSVYFNTASTGSIVIADIDNDCIKEIILASSADANLNPENLKSRLVCYDLNGNIKWISDDIYGKNLSTLEQNGDFGGGLILADFNQDGIAEVCIYNEIFNAANGKKLCDGGPNGTGKSITSGAGRTQSVCVAANFDDDPELELAAGFTIYDINITNPNGTTGNNMTPHNIDIGRFADGFTSVADLNEDGILDVVVSGGGFYQLFPPINIDLYGYTLKNNATELLFTTNDDPFSFYGPIMIDKNKSSNSMEFFVMRSGKNLFDSLKNYIFKPELNLKSNWHLLLNDNSNGTVPTLFDLDGDGIKEVIHRDEVSLKIFSLKTNNPTLLYSYPCISGTSAEMAIVADIDGTGEAKICVTCAQNINDRNGKLTIFGPPPGQHWAPARNIWHQYAYNPLFINDDGTVPKYMHNPATYKNGKYNNFMVQESLIDEDGNYPVAAASLFGDITCIDYDPVMKEYTVTFGVENRADASKTAGSNLPVSFYSGDPQAGGTLLTTYHTDVDVQAGERIERTVTIPETAMTSIWMIVNTDKYPIVVSDTSYYDIDECDYTDNVFIAPAPKIISTIQEICQGDSYDFYGDLLNTSGEYSHEIMNASGCDSVITILNLLVTNRKTAQETVATCENFNWNGSTYTQSGKYTYQTQSTNGCDSIVTLNLTIHPMESLTITQSACDSYSWNGNIYDTSGKYPFQSQTIFGCDSITTLDLTIHPSYDIKESMAACDSITWQGTTYNQSGIYTVTTKTAEGCDSIRTLDLTISNVLNTSESQSACTSYDWNGNTYTQSGQYTYQTMSSSGCDSLVTLDLIIHPMESLTIIQSACDGYTWHGMTYDTSGQYTYLSHTIFGCDSITTLDLTIHPSYDIKETMAACDSITWQGTTYKQSGVYSVATKTIAGCDSIRTLDLTVNYRSSSDDNQEACTIYLWNGTEYTSSGTYTYITKNQAGCDSLATLTLDIYPEFHQGDTIETDKDYLWPIDGRTYTESGQYVAVYASQEGCDSIYTLVLRINREISIVFPTIFNPSGTANPIFFGSSNRSDITLPNLSIYDRWGNIVFTKKNAQLNNPSDGWDGRYRGQSCAQGVYVWVAEVTYDDGHTEMLHGDVTVVR
ncbi:MAG: gliding motility-associated C-terminal domain-containing protein, partial [Saprospiraceae bacterium]|nr:gliding motility-associated C-terminal domain-containing protein [Saprospiraceae bacterium]